MRLSACSAIGAGPAAARSKNLRRTWARQAASTIWRGLARPFRLVEIAEPGVAVGRKNAAKAFEMSLRMLAFAIGAVKIGDRRRRLVGPGTPVAHICRTTLNEARDVIQNLADPRSPPSGSRGRRRSDRRNPEAVLTDAAK